MFLRISRQRNALIATIAHFFCSQYDSMMAADKDPQDKAKKKRGRNWTSREDDMLTNAWSKSTLNSIKGNYQKEGTYWVDIAKHYHASAVTLSLSERSIDGMQNRWSTINKACTKFNGVFTQVTRTTKSGWDDTKYLDCAFDVYHEEVKEKFNFYSCWLLVKDHPKWTVGEGSVRKLLTSAAETVDAADKSALSNEDVDLYVDAGSAQGMNCFSSAVKRSVGRPQGQKNAKDDRKREDRKDKLDVMNATSLRIRAEAHEHTVMFNVMKVLGPNDPDAKR